MEITLYADVLFLVNFSMDFISVWAASRLTSGAEKPWKMCLAASIGALYGVFAVILGFSGAISYLSAASVSVLMSLAAFGFSGSILTTLRQSAVIWAVGALLGGIMTFIMSLMKSADSNTSPVPLSAAIGLSFTALYITVRIIKRTVSVKAVTVTVFMDKSSVTFDALCDSGNLLCDPISGTPVLTVSEKVISPLNMDFSVQFAGTSPTSNHNAGKYASKIRFIPHRTANGQSVATAFSPDRVTLAVKNKKRDVKCLVMPVSLPENYFGGYCATVPASLINFI